MRSLFLISVLGAALLLPASATGQEAVLLVREIYSYRGRLLVIEETTTKTTTRREYATPRESAEPPTVYRSASSVVPSEPAPVYRTAPVNRAPAVAQSNPITRATPAPVVVVPSTSLPVGIATGPIITNVNTVDRPGVIKLPCLNGRCANVSLRVKN